MGAHMSIQGGVHRAIERGQALGCTALQIFTRNQVQWRAAPLTADDCERFRAAWAASGIGPIVAHANYLIDLASADERVARLSLDNLIIEFQRAAALGLRWVVLHPGCHQGRGEQAGLQQVAEAATRAMQATRDLPVGLLLETTAGQGTSLGWRFEQLAWLLEAISPPQRLGVCFDTCHVFAAGYDLRTPEAYEATMADFDRIVGLSRIHAIHLNDAKRELRSRVDRHEQIGRGKLGRGAFRCLLRDSRLAAVPKIIETPKEDGERDDWDTVNLRLLRRLARPAAARGIARASGAR
ncbi:MAG TPA: deoxyribonuclease IV [Planctomycetota bacterium]|nr:deoxyribonuclease IV [Planctomycetota bacterium]